MLSISELPYQEFEMLGLSKKDVLSFPPRTLIALLGGNRTSLIRFKNVSIGTFDNRLTLDGKLSLRKTPEDKLHLNFHPVNISPKNAFGLSPEEAASLANNLKKVILLCVKRGWLEKDPFIGYKMSRRQVEKCFSARRVRYVCQQTAEFRKIITGTRHVSFQLLYRVSLCRCTKAETVRNKNWH
jgi:hypothetical protein